MKSTKTLNQIEILVTRPAHQAESLCQLIEQQGGIPVRFPVIEITDIANTQHLSTQLQHLSEFDIAIFISPNAVKYAFKHLDSNTIWPKHTKIAAVGKSSVKALDSVGLIADIFPSQDFNSEALLELDAMHQVTGKRIIIFRGEGGRELLSSTLTQRGAIVEYAECYRRQTPASDKTAVRDKLASNKISIITCTSNEGLQNLYDMIGETHRDSLLKTTLVVISQRAATLAKQLGFKREPIVVSHMSDDAILNSIIIWSKMQQA